MFCLRRNGRGFWAFFFLPALLPCESTDTLLPSVCPEELVVYVLCAAVCHSLPIGSIWRLTVFVDCLLSPSTDGLPTPWSLNLQHSSFFSLSYAECIIFHFLSLSIAVVTGSVLDEKKAGFPAFSGIARLTWLIDLFGDLTVTSATREEQKDKNYSRMTVHFQTANKKWVMTMAAGEPACSGVICRSSASFFSTCGSKVG